MLRRGIESDRCCIIDSITRIYALTDTQWDLIKDLLQRRAGHVNRFGAVMLGIPDQ